MLLIQKATVLDPNSKHHHKRRDLLINATGHIEDIRATISIKKAKRIEARGAYLSPGWIDVGVQVSDPGYEHREDIGSVAAAAAAGGYTAILCQPNTAPVVHSKSEVAYLKERTHDALVDFFPMGAISRDCAGADLTEMNDMFHAGAVAFTDGKCPVQNSGLMQRALLYSKSFDGIVLNQPHDASLAANGQMHEGVVSTMLGMKGIPALAEELMARRDIALARYTDARLHLSNISTTSSVGMVKEARRKGMKLTASTTAMNLIFDDNKLADYDTHYKVMPPLREKKDCKALLKALKTGTLDFISSNHMPLEEEVKKLEFPQACFGAIGLETTYALLNTYLGDQCTQEEFVHWLSLNARAIFRLPTPRIETGELANCTLFHPKVKWTFTESDIRSKSRNSPYLGTTFTGKVLAVANNAQMVEN